MLVGRCVMANRGIMADRGFMYGCLLTGMAIETYHEYLGLEGYIASVRENWIPVGFPIMATITTLILFLYIRKSSRVEVVSDVSENNKS